MKRLRLTSPWHANTFPVVLICSCLSACASNERPQQSPAPAVLLGTWQVDLRPTPDSEPYYNEFVVTSVNDRTFSGTFYGTAVSQARINSDWGKLRIAFATADGSGAYHHSAVLDGDLMEGLSNSTGRDFLSYWSAVKQ